MENAGVWTNIVDILWPVGSLYYCRQNTDNNPSEILGGSWIEIGDSNLLPNLVNDSTGEVISLTAYYRTA